MHIGRAFCVEAGRVVDIYQARALFFAQEIPRRRFQFLCSDDACRGANATRVTGVNYDKLVEDGLDCIGVKPHFRMNQETPHDPGCEWVARERILQLRAAWDTDPTRSGGTNGLQRRKISALIDVFAPTFSGAAIKASGAAESTAAISSEQKARVAEHNLSPHRNTSTSPTRGYFLEAVVSVYESLEAHQRREAVLRIGEGPKLSYSSAFCHVRNYFRAKGERIFHGGVRVQIHGPNFAVRFFDRVDIPVEHGEQHALDVSLYLKRQMLLRHWNGRFLVAQLAEAAKLGNYAHCYFFGRIQPHPVTTSRLIAVVERLDYLAFSVRRQKDVRKKSEDRLRAISVLRQR